MSVLPSKSGEGRLARRDERRREVYGVKSLLSFAAGRAAPFVKGANMSAFVVGHITVKDEEGFNNYAEQGLAIVASVGGEFVLGGELVKVLTGEHDRQMFVLLKFPDQEAVEKWYYSDGYQALIPGRNEAVDITFISYNEPSE